MATYQEEAMAIAPIQPPRSWYRQFWYAERSPRDTLADRSLLFAIVALSLLAGGLVMARNHSVPIDNGQSPVSEIVR
jgi:hypothetical protein